LKKIEATSFLFVKLASGAFQNYAGELKFNCISAEKN